MNKIWRLSISYMDSESKHWNCRKLYLLQIFRIFCLLVCWLVGCWKCCSFTQNRPRPVDSEHSAIFQCMCLPLCRGKCEWRDDFQQGKVAKKNWIMAKVGWWVTFFSKRNVCGIVSEASLQVFFSVQYGFVELLHTSWLTRLLGLRIETFAKLRFGMWGEVFPDSSDLFSGVFSVWKNRTADPTTNQPTNQFYDPTVPTNQPTNHPHFQPNLWGKESRKVVWKRSSWREVVVPSGTCHWARMFFSSHVSTQAERQGAAPNPGK